MRKFDWARIVAVWQIAGGLVSAAYFLDVLPRAALPTHTWQTLLLVVLPICVLWAVAGRALYQGRPHGRRLSMAIWALQVPSLAVGPYRYGLTLGPYVYAGVFPAGSVTVAANFTPHVALMQHAPIAPATTGGINLLALLAIAVVWRVTRAMSVARLAPAA
jgi:hypothetical protein